MLKKSLRNADLNQPFYSSNPIHHGELNTNLTEAHQKWHSLSVETEQTATRQVDCCVLQNAQSIPTNQKLKIRPKSNFSSAWSYWKSAVLREIRIFE